jgi:hypothetical protein
MRLIMFRVYHTELCDILYSIIRLKNNHLEKILFNKKIFTCVIKYI